MLRREFIAGIGSAAAWPVVAQAQQAKMPVIGWLGAGSGGPGVTIPFLQALKETGYVAGVPVEYRYAENQVDRLPALAADLVRRRVAVIVAVGTSAGLAAKAATAGCSLPQTHHWKSSTTNEDVTSCGGAPLIEFDEIQKFIAQRMVS
jgi:putative ABC transport system substrate-binding protein